MIYRNKEKEKTNHVHQTFVSTQPKTKVKSQYGFCLGSAWRKCAHSSSTVWCTGRSSAEMWIILRLPTCLAFQTTSEMLNSWASTQGLYCQEADCWSFPSSITMLENSITSWLWSSYSDIDPNEDSFSLSVMNETFVLECSDSKVLNRILKEIAGFANRDWRS